MKPEAIAPITVREKIAIKLVLMILKMLKPWQFEHQFNKFYEDIDALLKEGK